MPRRLTTIEEFAQLGRTAVPVPLVRLAPAVDFTVDEDTRTIRYIFSNDAVARDLHTVAADAWDLAGFMANPVFLWAHDADDLPIGRVADIESQRGLLVGDVQYVEREIYPFADTVYQMVKNRWLRAVSTSWLPRPGTFTYSTDRSRPGGIDFTDVELLEISQVPVPAVPGALALARRAGIDTGPIFQWAEKTLDTGGLTMVPRAELETLRRDAKMPSSRNRAIAPTAPQQPVVMTRGLYSVGELAGLISYLGYLQLDATWEAEYEGDNSPVPGQLLDALKLLGNALVAMTIEEVQELIQDREPDLEVDAVVYEQAATTDAQRLLRRLVGYARTARPPEEQQGWIGGILQRIATKLPIGKRAGRVLSRANEDTLRGAHGAISQACETILSVIEQAAAADPEGEPEDDETTETERSARARRLRVASALQRRAKLPSPDQPTSPPKPGEENPA